MSVNIRMTVPPAAGSSARLATWWWLALGAFVEIALAVILLANSSVPLRTLFGLPLILVIPGYALTALLWGRHQLGAPERAALSIGISLALAALSALLLDWTPLGIGGAQQTLLLGLVALVAIVTVLLRDLGGRGSRPEAGTPGARRALVPFRRRQVLLFGVAVAIVASAVAYSAHSALRPRGAGFTQSWIHVQDAKTGAVDVGLENDERQAETYRLQLTLNNRPVNEWKDVRLEPGQQWSTNLSLPQSGGQGVAELAVYRSDQPVTVYRKVRVSLRASTG
jgi:uncharacterized membrane protein